VSLAIFRKPSYSGRVFGVVVAVDERTQQICLCRTVVHLISYPLMLSMYWFRRGCSHQSALYLVEGVRLSLEGEARGVKLSAIYEPPHVGFKVSVRKFRPPIIQSTGLGPLRKGKRDSSNSFHHTGPQAEEIFSSQRWGRNDTDDGLECQRGKGSQTAR